MYSNSMYMGLKVVPIEWPAESKCVGIRVDTHWGRGGWATPHTIYIYIYIDTLGSKYILLLMDKILHYFKYPKL